MCDKESDIGTLLPGRSLESNKLRIFLKHFLNGSPTIRWGIGVEILTRDFGMI
jgi:hypothetical protein